SGDHRDHRLRQVLDGALQIERIEPRHAVLADVAAMPADTLVATGAERLVACAGENHYADLSVSATQLEGVDQFVERVGPEGIAHLWAVDGDLADALRLLEDDVGVVFNLLPFECHREKLLLGCLYATNVKRQFVTELNN